MTFNKTIKYTMEDKYSIDLDTPFDWKQAEFLLSEYSLELSNMFIEDKEMVFFRNKAEFFKKIDFLLKNESMREKIGLNGFNVVNKRHDSFTRVEEIINTWK